MGLALGGPVDGVASEYVCLEATPYVA